MEIFWILGPIWVLFGITAAIVANSRGGDGFGAFLAGLFLGPLGLVIAFLMGSPERRDKRDVAAGRKKVCPRCAETVRRAALVCKHCGGEFDPAVVTTPSALQARPIDLKHEGFASDPGGEASSDPTPSASTDRWFLGSVVAVVVAVLLVMAITLTKANKPAAMGPADETNIDMLVDNLQATTDALDAAAAKLAAGSTRRDER